MHANNPGPWRSEELKVAHHGNRPALLILASDSHRPVDFRAEFAAEVLEQLWQGGMFGGPRRAASSSASTRRVALHLNRRLWQFTGLLHLIRGLEAYPLAQIRGNTVLKS